MACTIALCGFSASAQFTTGGGGKSASMTSSVEIKDYNQFGISYTNEAFKYDYPKDYDADDLGLNGFGLRYIHGFSLSKSLPMYIETGLKFNFTLGSVEGEDDEDYTAKYQHAALSVPVNFAWKFNINDNVAIKPYLGLNLKLNVIGRHKWEYTGEEEEDEYDYEDEEEDDESKWASWYSKKDMGDKDLVWNRFQLGWHIGADFQFNKFYVGLNYGTDFIPAQKYKKFKVNSATLNIGLGFCF